jgi:mRNA-degrading endonuclease RelE of RelBE toxin-antitoxin system
MNCRKIAEKLSKTILIDKVPDEKLSDLVKLIKLLAVPEEDATEDEIRAIKETTNDYKNGETHLYSIDELRKEFLMSRYRLELSKSSKKLHDKSDRITRERIIYVIHELTENPYSYPGIIKLTGYEDTYRVRIVKYRLIFK